MVKRPLVFKNKKQVRRAIRVLNDIIAGKKVSRARLRATQNFLLDLLEEINSKRSHQRVVCGGNVLDSIGDLDSGLPKLINS